MPPTSCSVSPVSVCLFLSASVPARCLPVSRPVWLTVSLCISTNGCLSNWQNRLSSCACVLCRCLGGAHLSWAKRWMALNPGDICWRDTLRCHYPCGESHHHPPAEPCSTQRPGEGCKRERKRVKESWQLWVGKKIVTIKWEKKKITRKKVADEKWPCGYLY